ncbi:hypothetical protein NMY22_g5749 [Coprinellus aureogranulatus]|nr:hypothetical protein NMY22_g5749 [Coprinellus aureogranulatus]
MGVSTFPRTLLELHSLLLAIRTCDSFRYTLTASWLPDRGRHSGESYRLTHTDSCIGSYRAYNLRAGERLNIRTTSLLIVTNACLPATVERPNTRAVLEFGYGGTPGIDFPKVVRAVAGLIENKHDSARLNLRLEPGDYTLEAVGYNNIDIYGHIPADEESHETQPAATVPDSGPEPAPTRAKGESRVPN